MIYSRNGEIYGNEGHTITNSRFGDFFDVIYDDLNSDVYKKYDYLIDTTPDNSFTRSSAAKDLNIIDSSNVELLTNKIGSLINDIFPCTVSGGLHWMLSTVKDKWLLSIFNNEGVDRSAEKGDYLIREADKKVEIEFKYPINKLDILHSLNTNEKIEIKCKNSFYTTVGAGGFIILEFV